jgi:hypothetical protein
MVGSPAARGFVWQERGSSRQATGARFIMAATGELIRLINYVDDIVTTLRRISASIPTIDADERKRLAEHIRTANSSLTAVLAQLEKGGQ